MPDDAAPKVKPLWRRLLRSLLTIGFGTYVGAMIIAVFFGDWFLFQPPDRGGKWDLQGMRLIKGADGRAVSVLDLRWPEAKYTVLFSHGNAEDLRSLRPFLEDMHRQGVSIFAYDYPGYGMSEGSPSEAGAVAAHQAAFDELTKNLKVPPERIVLHGRSLGAAVALEKAARGDAQVGGLILESPFLSAYRVLTPVPIFPRDRFPNLDRIGDVRCRLFVIHGEDDTLIPIRHGKRLFDLAEKASSKKSLWIAGVGHNDVAYMGGRRYMDALQTFLADPGR